MIVGKLENRGTVCQYEIASLTGARKPRLLPTHWDKYGGVPQGVGVEHVLATTESQTCPTVQDYSREFAKNRLGGEK